MSSNSQLVGKFLLDRKKKLFHESKNRPSEKKTNINEIKAVSYSDNLKPIIKSYHDKFGVTNYTKMKSSLKFCVIAASEYDIYISEPRASEWDIAAGHAILEHSGGTVTDFEGNEILYGKENLKNPSIILKNKNIL